MIQSKQIWKHQCTQKRVRQKRKGSLGGEGINVEIGEKIKKKKVKNIII